MARGEKKKKKKQEQERGTFWGNKLAREMFATHPSEEPLRGKEEGLLDYGRRMWESGGKESDLKQIQDRRKIQAQKSRRDYEAGKAYQPGEGPSSAEFEEEMARYEQPGSAAVEKFRKDQVLGGPGVYQGDRRLGVQVARTAKGMIDHTVTQMDDAMSRQMEEGKQVLQDARKEAQSKFGQWLDQGMKEGNAEAFLTWIKSSTQGYGQDGAGLDFTPFPDQAKTRGDR